MTCATVWPRWLRMARAARGVLGFAGGEDLVVLGVERVPGHAFGGVDLLVGSGGVAQPGDEGDQALPARELVQAHVKAMVQLDIAVRVGARGHLVEERAQGPARRPA